MEVSSAHLGRQVLACPRAHQRLTVGGRAEAQRPGLPRPAASSLALTHSRLRPPRGQSHIPTWGDNLASKSSYVPEVTSNTSGHTGCLCGDDIQHMHTIGTIKGANAFLRPGTACYDLDADFRPTTRGRSGCGSAVTWLETSFFFITEHLRATS